MVIRKDEHTVLGFYGGRWEPILFVCLITNFWGSSCTQSFIDARW